MRRTLVVLAAIFTMSAPAAGAAAPRQSFSGTFTGATPDASSGYRLAIDYRDPANPEGKPHAVQQVLQELNAGARLDTSVPKRCTASDAELSSQGASACPADTRVGEGELDADMGQAAARVPRVIKTRVTVFNANREVILFAESTNAGEPPIRVSSRSLVGERTFTSSTPAVPAFPPPDPYLAIKRVRLSIDAVGADGRAFIRTPPSCPRGGAWTNAGSFTYRDGVVQTMQSSSPCSRPDRWAPRIRARGVPRRRCTARPFRARVRIGEHNRLRRAAVSVDRRRLRVTTRRRFGVRIATDRLRPGRHRLRLVALDAAGNRATKTISFRRC